ncbi:MAG: hypothetical protein GF347_04465 [Candidatus Moranbacteria bacterium]|nr:hypothetical protein [Candidatus Moranbacteria bacterium]
MGLRLKEKRYFLSVTSLALLSIFFLFFSIIYAYEVASSLNNSAIGNKTKTETETTLQKKPVLFGQVLNDSIYQVGADHENTPVFNSSDHLNNFDRNDDDLIRILFGGDLMFDRYIRQVAQQKGNKFIFGDLGVEFKKADLAVVNLEGPITEKASLSLGSRMGEPSNFIFTFDPSIVHELRDKKITLVNIGNNHILNFGKEGLNSTKYHLKQGKINYFGLTGAKDDEDPSYFIKKFKDFKVGFVNYNSFAKDGLKKAESDIVLIRDRVDFLILYTHWDREYKLKSSQASREKAHKFIDLGVDLIIGSHPHVIQELEIYKGKRIYYSLGNLIFDQYFSRDTMEGMLVEVIINKGNKKTGFKETRIKMNPNGQTKLISQD